MSAREIIEEIKALPPEEQARVIDFINTLPAKPEVKYATDEAFRNASGEVLAKHAELLRKLAS